MAAVETGLNRSNYRNWSNWLDCFIIERWAKLPIFVTVAGIGRPSASEKMEENKKWIKSIKSVLTAGNSKPSFWPPDNLRLAGPNMPNRKELIDFIPIWGRHWALFRPSEPILVLRLRPCSLPTLPKWRIFFEIILIISLPADVV